METFKSLDSHYAFFNFVITKVFKILTDYVNKAVGDDCNRNHALSQEFDSNFVGFYYHRFTLKTQDYVKNMRDW